MAEETYEDDAESHESPENEERAVHDAMFDSKLHELTGGVERPSGRLKQFAVERLGLRRIS